MPAESMSLRDMLFWVFLTLFGTGTYVIYGSQSATGQALGIAMILVGLVGMISCAWPHLKDPVSGKIQLTREHLRRFVNIKIVGYVVGIALLVSIGFRIYRHYYPPSIQQSASAQKTGASGAMPRPQDSAPVKSESPAQPEQTAMPSSKAPKPRTKRYAKPPSINEPKEKPTEHANPSPSLPPVVTPPAPKTQDQTQAVASPPGIIPEDPTKAVDAVTRMRHSLSSVLGKKDTVTFLMSWPKDDNTNLVLISKLLGEACRDTPRQCWFTQPRFDNRDLDRPPIQGSDRSGITVHGPDARALATALGAWFSTYSTSTFPPELNGYKEEATKEIIWIEIGPGSPWKPTTK